MLLIKILENNIIYILFHRIAVLQLKLQTAEVGKVDKNDFFHFFDVKKICWRYSVNVKVVEQKRTYKMYMHFFPYDAVLQKYSALIF